MEEVNTKKTNKTERVQLVLRKSLSIYKNVLSSDLIEECHYHFVFFLLV